MLGNFPVGMSVMKLLGSQRLLLSSYTMFVSKFTASCEMMCKCAMGILAEFGSFSMMKGSTIIVGLMPVERRCLGSTKPTGFMMGGMAPGVLFLVLR